MTKSLERTKIGETFKYSHFGKTEKFRVLPKYFGCSGCEFHVMREMGSCEFWRKQSCSAEYRADRKNVILVDEDKILSRKDFWFLTHEEYEEVRRILKGKHTGVYFEED